MLTYKELKQLTQAICTSNGYKVNSSSMVFTSEVIKLLALYTDVEVEVVTKGDSIFLKCKDSK